MAQQNQQSTHQVKDPKGEGQSSADATQQDVLLRDGPHEAAGTVGVRTRDVAVVAAVADGVVLAGHVCKINNVD